MATTWPELEALALDAQEPALVSANLPRPGGVDPLGLRQLNFYLMDQVFPGINNVAEHIRPFTVVTWAWNRAARLANSQGLVKIKVSTLKDYVARVEVLFAWSQFLRNRDCGLPGRDVLTPLCRGGGFRFGGPAWEVMKGTRADSTALSAAINYGPALKAFGWIKADDTRSGAFIKGPQVDLALASLEEALGPFLGHPVFSSFGDVQVPASLAEAIAGAWALDTPADAERLTMRESLLGSRAPKSRKEAVELVIAANGFLGSASPVSSVRKAMCGAPELFRPPGPLIGAVQAWRVLQARQVFRLALESLLYWACTQLGSSPVTTRSLVQVFLKQAGGAVNARAWLRPIHQEEMGPIHWLERLHLVLEGGATGLNLCQTIRFALAASLDDAPGRIGMEREDRLPLARAVSEAEGWGDQPVVEFLTHVFDSWLFGQHVYWSVGRGLVDVRTQTRPILRLRVVMEETGWTRTPGALMSPPRATPDRLETMISLMREARLLETPPTQV